MYAFAHTYYIFTIPLHCRCGEGLKELVEIPFVARHLYGSIDVSSKEKYKHGALRKVRHFCSTVYVQACMHVHALKNCPSIYRTNKKHSHLER